MDMSFQSKKDYEKAGRLVKAENLDVDSCLEIGEKIFNVLASEGLSDT